MIGSVLVDAIRAAFFAMAHLLGGSLGAGVLAVSALLRLALLPLTLKVARRGLEQRRILAALKPELAELNARYKKDPEELWKRTTALHRRDGYKAFDAVSFFGTLARLPVFGGIYGALRGLRNAGAFGWIADLSKPDAVLAVLGAATSGMAAWLGAHDATGPTRAAWISAAIGTTISLVIFWHASSALVLSWGASSLVDAAQGILLARDQRRIPPAR